MFIVFDTNVWRSQLVLNSQAGAAVRFYIQQHGATVVIPEIVRLELERILARDLKDMTENIKKNYDRLLAVFGNLKEIVLPTPEQIQEKVNGILSHLDIKTLAVPFSLQVARASLLKIIDKSPPSSERKEEFRDGVIWGHCLDLLAEADVYLVTEDPDFYLGRDSSTNKLAKNLELEAAESAHKIILKKGLSELLESIRKDVHVDEVKLVKFFLTGETLTRVRDMLDRAGFVLGEPDKVEVEPYATGVATRPYIKFVMKYQCPDSSDQGRCDATLEIRGDGSYDTVKEEYFDLKSHGETLVYYDEEGGKKSESVVLAVGAAIIGHRSIAHEPRYPLS